METETVETVGVVVFNVDKTKVLLVKHLAKAEHLSNTYGIPAGRLEEGKSLAENALRELNEETGLQANEIDLVELPFEYKADIPRKDGSTKHFTLRTYICNEFTGDLSGNDENKPVWVPISAINKLSLLPNVEDIIINALNYEKD